MASLNQTKSPTPSTRFWTVHNKVTDEHDNNFISKCVGNLDISLLFVSAFTSLHIPFTSTASFCVRRVCSLLSLPGLSLKSLLESGQIPSISQMPFSSEYCSKRPRCQGAIFSLLKFQLLTSQDSHAHSLSHGNPITPLTPLYF